LIDPARTDQEGVWTVENLERIMKEYYLSEHTRICTDTPARSHKNTYIKEDVNEWLIQQVLVDPDGHNDWMIDLILDLKRTRAENKPIFRLNRVGLI
jgi:Domain of unknown function (DUF3516)